MLEAPFLPFLPELNAVAEADFFTAAPIFFLAPPPAFFPLGGMVATSTDAHLRSPLYKLRPQVEGRAEAY